MILTIHQPEYLPWMGFFNKIMYSDVYVALDNVQYRHKYFQNRNRISTNNGECWLNVPVYRRGSRDLFIQDVKINNNLKWRGKTWKTIFLNYKNSPYFDQYSDYFESLYLRDWDNLVELNMDVIKSVCKFLGLRTKIVRSSDLGIDGLGVNLILDICKKFNPDIYISGESGIAGRGKCDDEFAKTGIKVLYQNFKHPKYSTVYPFVPNMSILDLLFNCGSDSVDILKNDGGWYNE